MSSHVIVALDGTPYAETILPHALFIAQQTRSDLTLLRVIQPPGEPVYPVPSMPDDWYQGEAVWTNTYLSSVASRLRASGADVHIDHAEGTFAGSAITDYAAQQSGTQIIALASHGRDAAGRLFLGSVAEHLLASAPTSLLLMHPAKDAGTSSDTIVSANYQAVLVPFEGSALDELALKRATSLAMASHASLQLIGFLTPSAKDEARIDEIVKPLVGEQPYKERRLADSLTGRADELRTTTGLTVETILIDEKPEQFIERYSKLYQQRMLVVAPRGQKRRSAMSFLHHSNAPALLVDLERPE